MNLLGLFVLLCAVLSGCGHSGYHSSYIISDLSHEEVVNTETVESQNR